VAVCFCIQQKCNVITVCTVTEGYLRTVLNVAVVASAGKFLASVLLLLTLGN
jgi:hypothetical protein